MEESFTGPAVRVGEVLEASSTESFEPSRGSFEESSSKLSFRGKRGGVSSSHQKKALLSLESSSVHHGWSSLIFPIVVSVVLILFIVSLGLQQSSISDPVAARGVL